MAVAAWLALGAAGLLAHAHIDDVTAAGQSSFPARRFRIDPGRGRAAGGLDRLRLTVVGLILVVLLRALVAPASRPGGRNPAQ